jgi:hypothetical protein
MQSIGSLTSRSNGRAEDVAPLSGHRQPAADPWFQLCEPAQGLPNDGDPDATRGVVR